MEGNRSKIGPMQKIEKKKKLHPPLSALAAIFGLAGIFNGLVAYFITSHWFGDSFQEYRVYEHVRKSKDPLAALTDPSGMNARTDFVIPCSFLPSGNLSEVFSPYVRSNCEVKKLNEFAFSVNGQAAFGLTYLAPGRSSEAQNAVSLMGAALQLPYLTYAAKEGNIYYAMDFAGISVSFSSSTLSSSWDEEEVLGFRKSKEREFANKEGESYLPYVGKAILQIEIPFYSFQGNELLDQEYFSYYLAFACNDRYSGILLPEGYENGESCPCFIFVHDILSPDAVLDPSTPIRYFGAIKFEVYIAELEYSKQYRLFQYERDGDTLVEARQTTFFYGNYNMDIALSYDYFSGEFCFAIEDSNGERVGERTQFYTVEVVK